MDTSPREYFYPGEDAAGDILNIKFENPLRNFIQQPNNKYVGTEITWKGGVLFLALLSIIVLNIFAPWLRQKPINQKYGFIRKVFDDTQFDHLVDTRHDLSVEYTFNNSPPIENIPPQYYSVRWAGHLMIEDSGIYEFETRSDDQARFWINDQLLIDDGEDPKPGKMKKSIFLAPGQYRIRLDYVQTIGRSSISLRWKPPFEKEYEILPPRYTRPIEGESK